MALPPPSPAPRKQRLLVEIQIDEAAELPGDFVGHFRFLSQGEGGVKELYCARRDSWRSNAPIARLASFFWLVHHRTEMKIGGYDKCKAEMCLAKSLSEVIRKDTWDWLREMRYKLRDCDFIAFNRPARSTDEALKRFGVSIAPIFEAVVVSWVDTRNRPVPPATVRRCLLKRWAEVHHGKPVKPGDIFDIPDRANAIMANWIGLASVAPYGSTVSSIAPMHAPVVRLPACPTHCFGRASFIEQVVQSILLTPPRPIPLTGPAGVGKSTVALAAIHDPRAVERFGDRRYFVRCDAALSRESLIAEIIRAVGITAADPEPALFRFLAAAPTLIALDNFETPWQIPKATAEVEELLVQLSGIPGLAVIASIRGIELPVGPAWQVIAPVSTLDRAAAREAFLAVAPRHKGDPSLDKLLSDVDGLPLAIMLMASIASIHASLDTVIERWRAERAAMLTRGPAHAHRLSNLVVSVELSLRCPRMSDQARDLISLLALLPDGILCSDLPAIFPHQPHAAADQLRRTALAYDSNKRLRLLAPIRECVVSTLTPSATMYAPLEKHFIWLANLASNVGTSRGGDAVARIHSDLANIEAVIRRALSGPSCKQAIAAAVTLTKLVRLTGYGSTTILQAALEAATATDDAILRADCLKGLGEIAITRHDHRSGEARILEALAIYQRKDIKDVRQQASCMARLAAVAMEKKSCRGARTRFLDARRLFRSAGDFLGEADSVQGMGEITFALKKFASARKYFEQAQRISRGSDEYQLGRGNCLWRLGDIACRENDRDTARRLYQEALAVYEAGRIDLGAAHCIRRLGEIAQAQKDYDQAKRHFETALPLYERVGEFYSVGRIHYFLAQMATDGDVRRRHVARAIELWTITCADNRIAEIKKEFPDCLSPCGKKQSSDSDALRSPESRVRLPSPGRLASSDKRTSLRRSHANAADDVRRGLAASPLPKKAGS
jgi:tetratricopeptide (TPR) repeat protein